MAAGYGGQVRQTAAGSVTVEVNMAIGSVGQRRKTVAGSETVEVKGRES